MTSWLEVSLTVDGELAEAVADVLARFAPNGVVLKSEIKFVNDEDEGAPTGPVRVCAYLPVDEHLAVTRRKLEEALWYLGRIQALPSPAFKPITDQNWMEAWKQHYKPVPIGKRLIIVPAWIDSPDGRRIAVKIDPGMAFGTGTHPTTQLCLELLEEWISQVDYSGQIEEAQNDIQLDVIDIGCGSGILSIAALKLGARHALGVDIDEAAIRSARENACANGVGENLLLGVGSVAEIRAGEFAFKQASVVLVNILAPVIIRLFNNGLRDTLAPGGVMILSGILQEQVEAVLSTARVNEVKLIRKSQKGDWVAMVLG